MAKLAIKGHATRGKEVIEILKMLGGEQFYYYTGTDQQCYYTIIDGKITLDCPQEKYKVFSLEEFLEKFPHKVGDKVMVVRSKNTYIISQMIWNGNEVVYALSFSGNNICWFSVNELQPYKEETMETITIDDFKANTKEWLIDKLESMSKDNALQTINNIYDELHKPKYPKTYGECKIQIHEYFGIRQILGYKFYLIEKFQQLLICRDTYWKIAGEQMGLGKPWKPDWKDDEQFKYIIICKRSCIIRDIYTSKDVILVFPTEEMRDAFYENFKDLIEQCKELL